MTISDTQLHRYARQIIMKEIDEEGQNALLSSKVAILGAGGLGAPVIANLAAAGVGELLICDNDTVDLSNLNRQFIHRMQDIGNLKTQSAKRFIEEINSDVAVRTMQQTMDENSLFHILADCDVLIDCADQYQTKYNAAKAAFKRGIPHIFGGAIRFDGQIASFLAGVDGFDTSPCFACLFPKGAEVEQAPNCAQAGILSPITGVIGNLQALEAIKWITKSHQINGNTLLIFDGFTPSFTSIKTSIQPDCSICSK